MCVWILRNSAAVTRQLRISQRYQSVIDRLGLIPPEEILEQHQLSPQDLELILTNRHQRVLKIGDRHHPPNCPYSPNLCRQRKQGK